MSHNFFSKTLNLNKDKTRPWDCYSLKMASYIREAGIGSCLGPALLQVIGPVEVLALVSWRPLQTHAVLQAPLDGQDARRVGVTHHRPRLSLNREVVQRDLEIDVVVDLRREKTAERLTPPSNKKTPTPPPPSSF